MSGIAGIIHFDGQPVELGQIDDMTSAMSYRGPDGINHWASSSVALGHCLLCSTSESLEECQPLCNEDSSLVLVVDGRLDNWRELRQDLLREGLVLRSRSDSELILRSYELWGEDCLSRFDGDFALVLWDSRRRTVFSARDRMGHKPFYYHWNGKTLAFASDLAPILALPWVAEHLNTGMLAEWLSWEFYSRDETFWKEVYKLQPAHRMRVDARGPQSIQYWSPATGAILSYKNDDDYIEHYRELLFDIVRRMSRTHGQLAFEVSGGLDSSALFCVADSLRQSGELHASEIKGYTLAFQGESDANELAYARAVADYLGVPVLEITPTVKPLDWYSRRAAQSKNFPGFPNAVMDIGIRERASAASSVIVTGQGGDEWLQGSRLYYAEELAQGNWRQLMRCLSIDIDGVGLSQTLQWLLRYGAFELLPSSMRQGVQNFRQALSPRQRQPRNWLPPSMYSLLQDRRRSFSGVQAEQGRLGQRDLQQYLHEAFDVHSMELGEATSASCAMEERHPLRSHRLVQFSFALPERLHLRGDRSKYVHVEALRNHMPSSILERQSKAEFSSTFRGQLTQMGELLTKELPSRHPDWVSSHGIGRIFEDYTAFTESDWRQWVLWCFFACDSISGLPSEQ
ncbi:MAG: asparagine synthase (glutamine-hydrolyzing) [Halioglobus sp.]